MKSAAFILFLALAACADDRPPAPTAEESVRLNEAEAMLDEAAAEEQRR